MGRGSVNTEVMNSFLAGVEGRALRMVEMATGNREDALDLVQEAMIKLVQRYGHKDKQEWGPLFHRILQTGIRDWYRRQRVRNRFRGWFGVKSYEAEEDPFHRHPDRPSMEPLARLEAGNFSVDLEALLTALPLRQQQAFLLRAWEGFDVAQTAAAMGCSQGSVKTHYARAMQALRKGLEQFRT